MTNKKTIVFTTGCFFVMAPALGLPSLRSRTSLARRRTTPAGTLVMMLRISGTHVPRIRRRGTLTNKKTIVFTTGCFFVMAPALGFEPRTKWLTATYSTAELCRSVLCYLICHNFEKNASSIHKKIALFFIFFQFLGVLGHFQRKSSLLPHLKCSNYIQF